MIGAATDGLAGVRVARPTCAVGTAGGFGTAATGWVSHDTEFAQLVVLTGEVDFESDGGAIVRLAHGDSVAIPGRLEYRLSDPTDDCQLLDVTMPATFDLR